MLPNEVYVAIFSHVHSFATFAALCLVSKETRANAIAAVAALNTGSRTRRASCLAPFAERAGQIRLSGAFVLTRLKELELLARFVPGDLSLYLDLRGSIELYLAGGSATILPEGATLTVDPKGARFDAAVAALLARGKREGAAVAVYEIQTGVTFLSVGGHIQTHRGGVRSEYRKSAAEDGKVAWPNRMRGALHAPSQPFDLLVVGRYPFLYQDAGPRNSLKRYFGKKPVQSIVFTHAVDNVEYRNFCDTMVVPFEPSSVERNLADAPTWKHIGLHASPCASLDDALLRAVRKANPHATVHLFVSSEREAEVMRVALAEGLQGTEVWHVDEPEARYVSPSVN